MTVKALAAIAAIFTLFIFMFAPLLAFHLALGIPLDAKGPEWGGWALVVGGGIGAGAGRLIHDLICERIGGLTRHAIDENWHGRKRSSDKIEQRRRR
ncbi:MAG: hypothetical protein AAGJ87_07755 [Pseudomonadota bacterium]